MAYPGQRWQQQHQPQSYTNNGYEQQQPYPQPWQEPAPNSWQPNAPQHGPYAGQGPMYGGNNPAYPGHQYNQQGYIQDGPNPPYGEPRPYPPSQYGAPPVQPPQHYGEMYGGAPPPPPQYNFAPVHQKPQYEANQPFYYKYSECTGKRKALLIGINYTGTSAALRGCHNDVRNMSRFLSERYNYKSEDMVLLMDDPSFGWRQQPTRQNILEAMRWLVSDARPNDSLFFHYSGHGGQAKDVSGDEDDGHDETIYPLDHKQAGMITDDEMHAIMVKPLPAGCRLTAIYDSCHSGTALDLPYVYDTSGKIKEPNLFKDAGMGAVSAVTSYLKGDLGGVFSNLSGVGKKFMNTNSGAADRAKKQNTSPADVISWSGCKDIQTSADATEAGKATGAMSWGFVTALTKYPQQSYIQLLNTIRDELAAKYSQKPDRKSVV